MIIYGTNVFNKLLGFFGEVHERESCHIKYRSRLLRRKTWMHIMFIFFCPFGTKYKKVCPICFKQEELTKKQVNNF